MSAPSEPAISDVTEMMTVPISTWNVLSWLHTKGSACRNMSDMIKGCMAEIRRNGIPVDRFFLATTMIHSQASAWIYKWESVTPENVSLWPLSREVFDRRLELNPDGPINQLEFQRETLRIRATDEHIPGDCRELFEARGYVDMYGHRYLAMEQFSGGITWTTKREEGFADKHIAFFEAIVPALSTVIQLLLKDLSMQTLLRTYLGKDAGARVHRGSVRRGDGVTMRSVIWFSDIRNFTLLSGKLDRDIVISLINDVFEITELVLRERGGDVLKFMGDGLMGVFSAEEGDEEHRNGVCRIARLAAQDFQTRLCELRAKRSKEGLPVVDVGVGLHYGDVSYGNIGAPTRLDFTVIGPAVNLASRVESLCSKLKVSVLATDEFVKRDEGIDAWKSRGEHVLKGVAKPVSVFELVAV